MIFIGGLMVRGGVLKGNCLIGGVLEEERWFWRNIICLDWVFEIIEYWFYRGNWIICFVMEDFFENVFLMLVFIFL